MLKQATAEHLEVMMPWFSSAAQIRQWAGPRFRFPFDRTSFIQDTKLDKLHSRVLIDDEVLLGFGQFYARAGRCHLGRLVINPAQRGRGYIQQLVEHMIKQGQRELELAEVSLFVLPDNAIAIRAYKQQGFAFAQYPGDDPVPGMVYMVRPAV